MDIRNFFGKTGGTSGNKKNAEKVVENTKRQPKKRVTKKRGINDSDEEETSSKIPLPVSNQDENQTDNKGKSKRKQKKIKVEEAIKEVAIKEEAIEEETASKYSSDKRITRIDSKARKSELQSLHNDESKPTEITKSNTNKGFTTGPPAPGSKEIPVGSDNCLLGMTFVFTGDLESLNREESQDLVKKYGGKVTAGPSSRTSYVVVGEDPGPKKMEKVQQLKIPTLTEDQLLELIRTSPGKSDSFNKSPKMTKSRVENIVKDSVQISNSSDSSDTENLMSQLWTEKYKPKSIKEICGNKSQVENLQKWLNAWESNHKTGFKFQSNNLYPAALISGNPGIGKTTAAHLIGKLEGYDVKEFNASDTRNKKELDEVVKITTQNTSIAGFFHHESLQGSKRKNANKILIIMDEVDGMSAGDRGGMAELVKLIRKTQVPIICICNDRKSPKIRSLLNVCQEFKFQKPRVEQIRSRIMTIATREKIKFNTINVVDELVKGANADIRQILTLLSSLKYSHNTINYEDAKEFGKASEKDADMNLWEMAYMILGTSTWNPRNKSNLNDKLDLYFLESDLLPLMIQENYLKIKPERATGFVKNNEGNPHFLEQLVTMEALSKAADCISDGDLVDRMIHGTQQHWSLMPFHGMMSCVLPAYYAHGNSSGQANQFTFPSWLGQNSKAGKYSRLLKEIQIHMRLRISGDKNEVRLNYLPTLSKALSLPLICINKVINLMDYYYLTKDDWDAIMELGVGSNDGEKILKEIDKYVKTNFTKRYNVTSHPMSFLKASTVNYMSKSGSTNEHPDFDEAIEPEEDSKEEEVTDEENDLSKDKFIKTVGQNTSRGKRNSSSASNRGRGSRGGGSGRGSRKSASKK
ncbi:599_t:CDS:10 [Diversispora eburnea]|uniref:Replication factor C subunit 1 n=1 Tax=Diversispora eburnea TaxID=1213867 RepID=A0A9N9GCG7_9GLOM|nr:599_t:CDS:10 [Diversispora eburnea]